MNHEHSREQPRRQLENAAPRQGHHHHRGWLLFALPVVLVIKFIGAVIELSGSYNGGTMGSGDTGFVVLLSALALCMVAAPLLAGVGHYRASFPYQLLAWVTGIPSVLVAGFLYLAMIIGARL